MREGYYSDKYFVRAASCCARIATGTRHDAGVRQGARVLAGIDEALRF